MPKLNFNVSKSMLEDLLELASIETSALGILAVSLDGESACVIKPSDLRKKILETAGSGSSAVIERVIMGLATFQRKSGASAEDVAEVLARGIAQSNWDETALKSWERTGPALRKLLDRPSIIATAKAVDLLYDYDAFYVTGNIITDIRPVFDDRREAIVGAAVNHTFRLAYSDGAGKQTDLSLILDLDDIQKLKKACEGALRKGGIILEDLRTKWGITSLTIDEIKNDRD
jgi:hypothetical protein